MQKWEEKLIEREKALAEGRQEGRKAGREEGRESAILDSIENLMETAGWTAEQAMIALRVPDDERGKYYEMMEHTENRDG